VKKKQVYNLAIQMLYCVNQGWQTLGWGGMPIHEGLVNEPCRTAVKLWWQQPRQNHIVGWTWETHCRCHWLL